MLYGNNKGLIEETIKNTVNDGVYDKIKSHKIINNVEAAKEEILNKSLFESEKFLIINRCNKFLYW